MAQAPFEVSGDIIANKIIATDTNPEEAPMIVSSEIVVTHLNADLLDGHSSEFFIDYNNLINTPSFDAPPLDPDLVSISELDDNTFGFLKKTGIETWAIDTNEYSLTSHVHDTLYEKANDDLHALASFQSPGFPKRTSKGVWSIVPVIGDTLSIGFVQDLSNSSTTSTNWQTKLTLSFTLSSSQTCIFNWGSVLWCSSATRDQSARIIVDDTTTLSTLIARAGSGTGFLPFNGSGNRLSLNAGNHSLKLQFVSPSGGVVNIQDCFLEILQLN